LTTDPEIEDSYPAQVKNCREEKFISKASIFKRTVNEGVSGCKVTTYPEIEGSYPPRIKNSGEEKSTSK